MKRVIAILIVVMVTGFSGQFAGQLAAQGINLKIGAFYPSQESDLWQINRENLYFDKQDMLGAYFGLELEGFVGRFMSLTVEGGRYDREYYTAYRDYEHDDGSAINQDFYLQMTFLETTLKLYPFGNRGYFNPYIGAGVGIYFWEYGQGGEFIDFETDTTYEGQAVSDRAVPGINIKGGFVYRFQENMGIGLEARYTILKDDFSSQFEGFEKFDLSGLTFTVGLNIFLR